MDLIEHKRVKTCTCLLMVKIQRFCWIFAFSQPNTNAYSMQLIDVLINVVLALVMFGIGASLHFRDFRGIFAQPKALLLGLFFQMVFLPGIAFGIVLLSELNPVLKVGLFITALCPGGTASNFISYLVKANVALSIALTSINSFLILITIPTLSNFAISYFIGRSSTFVLPVGDTVFQVFLIILVPAFVGVTFNERFPRTSASIQTPLKYINIILLGLVFGIKIFAGESSGGSGLTFDDVWHIVPYALGIHLLAMVLSFFTADRLLSQNDLSNTIGIEVGLQNTTLALLITGTLIGNAEMTKPPLVYSMFIFFTTLAFAWIIRRRHRTSKK